jgi:arylsulfatase A-like enzyme
LDRGEKHTVRGIVARLLFAALLTASSVSAAQADPAAQARPRPNIIFIMSDDHAYQAISAYGSNLSKLAPTPNIDRIAKNGAIFLNSYVTNSLCGPSRGTMLTGQFSHMHGFTRNGQHFDNSRWVWPRELSKAGYQTALFGKWHLNKSPEGIGFDD